MAEQADRGRRVEQVAAELQEDREIRPALDQLQGEVELGRTLGRGQAAERSERETRQLALLDRRAVQQEHHLEERRAREAPLGRQLFDQALERQVLVGVGGERRLAHHGEQAGEGRLSRRKVRDVGAQRQGVGEEADQPFELGTAAVGDRRPHHQVGLAGQPVEQGVEGREEGHERRRAGLPSHRPQRFGTLRGEGRGGHAATAARPRRARPVGRQVEDGRSAGQRAAPEGELGCELRSAQARALPEDEIGVLHRQRREGRRQAGGKSRIERRQLAHQEVDRPAVAHHVMQGEERDVARGVQAQQRGAQQRPARQVERAHHLLGGEPQGLRLARLLRQAREVDAGKRQRGRRGDPLHRLSVSIVRRSEGRPQRLVPRHHLLQAGGEGRAVERAGEQDRGRQVVGRVPRLELVEEPEPLLREGERQGRAGGPPRDRSPGAGSFPWARREGRRELRGGRRLENAPQRQLRTQLLVQARHQMGGQERVPPRSKKPSWRPTVSTRSSSPRISTRRRSVASRGGA